MCSDLSKVACKPEKAAPAIGSVKTNVVGSFDIEAQNDSAGNSSWAAPAAQMVPDTKSGPNQSSKHDYEDQDIGLSIYLKMPGQTMPMVFLQVWGLLLNSWAIGGSVPHQQIQIQ